MAYLGQALAQKRNNLSIFTPALALVFKEHDLIKSSTYYFDLLVNILIASVLGAADNNCTALGRYGLNGLHQYQHGV